MSIKSDELRFEIKELISLVRLDEKYASVVAEGLLPIDQQFVNSNLTLPVAINRLLVNRQ